MHPSLPLSDYWDVDSACSINLSTHCDDFLSFTASNTNSEVGGVGVSIHDNGIARIRIPLQSGTIIITRDLFALFNLYSFQAPLME
jgi:hypothetical protein